MTTADVPLDTFVDLAGKSRAVDPETINRVAARLRAARRARPSLGMDASSRSSASGGRRAVAMAR